MCVFWSLVKLQLVRGGAAFLLLLVLLFLLLIIIIIIIILLILIILSGGDGAEAKMQCTLERLGARKALQCAC